MTYFEDKALRLGARVGREIPRNDQLLDFQGGAMKSDGRDDGLFDEPAGDTISDFHLAPSITFREQSAEGMPLRDFGSRSTSGDARPPPYPPQRP